MLADVCTYENLGVCEVGFLYFCFLVDVLLLGVLCALLICSLWCSCLIAPAFVRLIFWIYDL